MNKKKNNNTVLVILASGKSERFRDAVPKQYKKINKKTVLEHSVDKFINNSKISTIYIAYNKNHKKYIEPLKKKFTDIKFVIGSSCRQKSALTVLNILYQVKLYKYVILHDAVRPFVSVSLISKIIKKLLNSQAIIPVIPIKDSIKLIKKEKVIRSLDRKDLFLSQTPQGFVLESLMNAYKKIKLNKLKDYTDDAQIFADAGLDVNIIKGEENNFKITEKNDYIKAQNMFNSDKITKVGQGIDVHGFIAEKKNGFKLFGVKIPFNKSIKAHSDGDVGIHALIDAILGTISYGDIGTNFPDDDKKYKNINSLTMLNKTIKILERNKGKIVHIDNTIVCEKPKINKYVGNMRKVIADFLKIDINSVSIKATTTEKLGFIGKSQGIAVFSTVTINFINEK